MSRELPMQGIITSTDGVTAMVDAGGATVPATLLAHTSSLGAGARVLLGRFGSMLVVLGGFTSGTGGTVYGPELLPNPSFEFGSPGNMPTSWNQFWSNPTPDAQSYADWSNTPGVPHSGTGVCRVPIPAVTGGVNHNVSLSDAIRVDPASTLRVAAWVKASAIVGASAKVTVFTGPTAEGAQPFGAGGSATDIAVFTDPGAAWQELAGPFTVPAGHEWLRVFLNLAVPSNVALTAWWDDASVKQTS